MRYLRKMDDGYVYGWTRALEERPDMVECDKDGHTLFPQAGDGPVPTTEMDIGGANYDVPDHLVEAITALAVLAEGREAEGLEAELKKVGEQLTKALGENGDLRKEVLGLSSSAGDLQAQLSAKNEELSAAVKDRDAHKEEAASLEREVKKLEKDLKKAQDK
jgi:hypothetical protein